MNAASTLGAAERPGALSPSLPRERLEAGMTVCAHTSHVTERQYTTAALTTEGGPHLAKHVGRRASSSGRSRVAPSHGELGETISARVPESQIQDYGSQEKS